ncbi:cytochrome b-c1 complex subunit 8 [Chytridium lagenaria]|nr:cytochrome b-c1 complex subunit 8 [Chytridium lagenaria]
MGKGKWWGGHIQQVGFYEYGLSPFQQKLFAGFFTVGGKKFVGRMGKNLMYIVPPALLFYSIASYADKKFEYYNRKGILMSDAGKEANAH